MVDSRPEDMCPYERQRRIPRGRRPSPGDVATNPGAPGDPGAGQPGSCSPEGQRELGPAQPGFRTSGSSLRENGFLRAVCGTSWSASFPPDSLRKWGAGRACFLYKGARAPSTGVTLEVLDSVLRDTLPATPLALPWGQGLTPPAPCAARTRLSPRARPPVCHELHVEGARRIPPAMQRRRPRLAGGAGAARS